MADCFFQVPELRGFEKFCEGRPVEEMPRITPRICGVCPEAHLMASAKACDAVYKVTLPLTARLIRELQYNIFYVTDHATHFYALGGAGLRHGPRQRPGRAQPDRRRSASSASRSAGKVIKAGSGATRRRRSSAAGR